MEDLQELSKVITVDEINAGEGAPLNKFKQLILYCLIVCILFLEPCYPIAVFVSKSIE